MDTTAFAPAPALAGFVDSYGLWEDEVLPGASAVLHPVLPCLVNGITVLCGEEFETGSFAPKEMVTTRPAPMGGMVAWRHLSLGQTGRVGVLGVQFWPAGFFHLFGEPLSDFTGSDLAPGLGGKAGSFARELEQRACETGSAAERLAAARSRCR